MLGCLAVHDLVRGAFDPQDVAVDVFAGQRYRRGVSEGLGSGEVVLLVRTVWSPDGPRFVHRSRCLFLPELAGAEVDDLIQGVGVVRHVCKAH